MATRRRASKLASAGEVVNPEVLPAEEGPKSSRKSSQDIENSATAARARGKGRHKIALLNVAKVAADLAAGRKQLDIAAEHGVSPSTVTNWKQRPEVRSLVLELVRRHSESLTQSWGHLVGHIGTALDPKTENIELEQRLEAGDRLQKILESADKAAAKIAELEQAQGAGEGGVLLEDLLLFWAKAREVKG